MSKARAPQSDFAPRSGREQAVSEAAYNERSNLAYPFEVPLPESCVLQGVVLADHVKSADLKPRRAKHVGAAPKEVLATVRAYIALLIGAK